MEKNSSFYQEDNQLVYTRLLNAPIELVWEVWTNPDHIKNWWGPDGFTISTRSMQVSPGNQWDFVMHGHGHDYENRVEYVEVNKPCLLVYKHEDDTGEISFTVRVSFEELDDKTFLTMRTIFKSRELLERLKREVGAVEGGNQTLNKLEQYLHTQQTSMTKEIPTD